MPSIVIQQTKRLTDILHNLLNKVNFRFVRLLKEY